MLVIGINIAILLLAGGLLYILHKVAAKKGEAPRFWGIIVLMVWGFIWVAERLIAIAWVDASDEMASYNHGSLLVLTILSCLLGYAIVLGILWKKPNINDLENKVDNIGKRED